FMCATNSRHSRSAWSDNFRSLPPKLALGPKCSSVINAKRISRLPRTRTRRLRPFIRIALRQQRGQSSQTHGFAPNRSARSSVLIVGHGVDVNPRRTLTDEVLQKERGRNGAAIWTRGQIGQVRYGGVQ